MGRRRILVSIVILVLLLAAFLSFAADYKYVGSSKAKKYHYPTCQGALKIKPENLVTFKTAKEAVEAEYVPCTVCKPPTED